MSINPVCVALDTPQLERGLALARALKPHVGWLKVGLEFLSALGPAGLEAMVAEGPPVFADVKFHDIPNTVAGAAQALLEARPAMFNVHASGGLAMMRAAAAVAADMPVRPKVIAVTVLTSLGADDLAAVGQGSMVADQVLRLASLAREAGLDGVVCSPWEAAAVRSVCGPEFLIVTPGVRPQSAAKGDQVRVMSPAEAKAAGADVLVIGRPITGAPDPVAAVRAILAELR